MNHQILFVFPFFASSVFSCPSKRDSLKFIHLKYNFASEMHVFCYRLPDEVGTVGPTLFEVEIRIVKHKLLTRASGGSLSF